jgi:hypothetical protein
MNAYLRNINKIEFAVTDACCGQCRHCSQGEHPPRGLGIDPTLAAETVKKIAAAYNITTVMAFGGEPLLHKDGVYAIMEAARQEGVPHRQVITSGYFSKNGETLRTVAQRLSECGVNDLRLSVDAFHQEFIPLETVKRFASCLVKAGIPLQLQPAWLVSREDDNPYNRKTREILAEFAPLSIPVHEGNVIFPEGNALTFLSEYFKGDPPANPYEEDPYDVTCVSIAAGGEVLGGNLYLQDIMEILETYEPREESV